MRIGLIAGRHPLPVERYLLTGEIDASPAGTRARWAALHSAVNALPPVGSFELYLTGLTSAALLAVDMLRRTHPRAMLTLVEYDAVAASYIPTLFATGRSQLLPVLTPATRTSPGRQVDAPPVQSDRRPQGGEEEEYAAEARRPEGGKEETMTKCPTCHQRQRARQDTVCRTCRRFIREYIDSEAIPRRPVPMVTDVLLTMRELGIDQDHAVLILGGTP